MTGIAVVAAEYATAWTQRRTPSAAQVCPGVWAVPMPLPEHPIRYSFAYLLEASGGRLVLVDAGFGSGSCWRALTSALRDLGAGVTDIDSVLLSHNHPDHVGLAQRVRADGGSWIGVHRLDAGGQDHLARYRSSPTGRSSAGAPDDVCSASAATITSYATMSHAPTADRLLEDGDVVRVGSLAMEVVWTPGHTPGHCCFRRTQDGLVLTGDHLLPEAPTQLGNADSVDSDPLGEVQDSLGRIAALGSALGLPGHQYPVLDVAGRAAAVWSGSSQMRALEAIVATGEDQTGWEVTAAALGPATWNRMGATGRRFAVVETMGLLHRLVRLRRVTSRPGRQNSSALSPCPPQRFSPAPFPPERFRPTPVAGVLVKYRLVGMVISWQPKGFA